MVPIILAFGKLKQENHYQFKTRLGQLELQSETLSQKDQKEKKKILRVHNQAYLEAFVAIVLLFLLLLELDSE